VALDATLEVSFGFVYSFDISHNRSDYNRSSLFLLVLYCFLQQKEQNGDIVVFAQGAILS